MITSIIFVHWAQNEERSDTMQKSIISLIATTRHLPVEIIVVDNGGSLEDSAFLLDLVHQKQIQFYLRNSENLYFGYARNKGVDLSCGDYLVFSDNDIDYQPGWLDKGLSLLEANREKKIAFTPLKTDRQHRNEKCWRGELEHEGVKHLCNIRAGSNSWLIRRDYFEDIGRFKNHQIAGSIWADAFTNKGYVMVTMEKDSLAQDIGFTRGYNFKLKPDLFKVFANGEKIDIYEPR